MRLSWFWIGILENEKWQEEVLYLCIEHKKIMHLQKDVLHLHGDYGTSLAP